MPGILINFSLRIPTLLPSYEGGKTGGSLAVGRRVFRFGMGWFESSLPVQIMQDDRPEFRRYGDRRRLVVLSGCIRRENTKGGYGGCREGYREGIKEQGCHEKKSMAAYRILGS